MKNLLYIFLFAILFASCSEYQKALKSEDIDLKTKVAVQKYEAEKYTRAIRLLDQVSPVLKGKPNGEDVMYMLSQSYYKTKQYYLAAYQFESFAALYPKSKKMEEALFLSADSYSKLSPVYSLDQTDTDKAIQKLQSFINAYPNSTYINQANEIAQNLRLKSEKKAFEIAKQYNTIEDYKAAIKALDNFIADYPGTPFKEKALYYKFNASYQLAINSVNSKMQERLLAAKIAEEELLQFNPNTEYKNQAEQMLARIDTDLKKITK